MLFDHIDFDAHEQVDFACDPETGLRAVLAIHDTRLGPALGGCRIWRYEDDAAALTDALRLSRGMTYKAAIAGLALGGGKSVILADARTEKTPAMMRAMGRAVDRLGGRYIVAEDVGATPEDMDEIARETRHVSGRPGDVGDPSPWTAEGVFFCLREAVRLGLDRDALTGVRVAVKGVGAVGGKLARLLAEAGARLVLADLRPELAEALAASLVAEHGPGAAMAAPVEEIAFLDVDVFAPCALGGELSADTIARLQAPVVCGAANNQLATAEDGARLAARGVLYCPDYLVNAGGVISVARTPLGLSASDARGLLEALPRTLAQVIEAARSDGAPPAERADQIAEARFRRR